MIDFTYFCLNVLLYENIVESAGIVINFSSSQKVSLALNLIKLGFFVDDLNVVGIHKGPGKRVNYFGQTTLADWIAPPTPVGGSIETSVLDKSMFQKTGQLIHKVHLAITMWTNQNSAGPFCRDSNLLVARLLGVDIF